MSSLSEEATAIYDARNSLLEMENHISHLANRVQALADQFLGDRPPTPVDPKVATPPESLTSCISNLNATVTRLAVEIGRFYPNSGQSAVRG